MEKGKALFNSVSFKELIANYDAIGFGWQIYKGNIHDRYARIKGKYDEVFQKKFRLAFEDELHDYDIVGFLDSLSLMKILYESISDLEGIDVFMEFKIPYGQFKRIDYLITFKNTIFLLEFTLFDNQMNSKKYNEIYHSKLTQVMQYEKLLQNLISAKIKTVPYVIVYSPDIDEKRKIIKNSNIDKMIQLGELIKFLYANDTLAIDEMKILCN
jgi:hypothetical protein